MLLLNNLGYFRSNARWSALCLRYRAFSNKTIARLQREVLSESRMREIFMSGSMSPRRV
jgi:hypothetical protein